MQHQPTLKRVNRYTNLAFHLEFLTFLMARACITLRDFTLKSVAKIHKNPDTAKLFYSCREKVVSLHKEKDVD